MGEYEEYTRLAKLIRNVIFTESDEGAGSKIREQIVDRDKKYTELLRAYTKITKVRFWLKEAHKWIFFWLVITASIVCLTVSCRLIGKVLQQEDIRVLIDAVPVIIAAFTAFVSTVIAVPLAITKFLFNTQEDDNITTLIKHTQDHDLSGINALKEQFSKRPSGKNSTTQRQETQPFQEVSGD